MSRGENEAVGVIVFPFLSSLFLFIPFCFFPLPYSFAWAGALWFFYCVLFFLPDLALSCLCSLLYRRIYTRISLGRLLHRVGE